MSGPNLYSTRTAAEKLGVTPGWIVRLIRAGRANASKLGRDYVLTAAEVERLKNEDRPKTGRPKKERNAKKSS